VKKFLTVLLVMTMIIALGTTVAAATEADIITALSNAKVPAVYISQAESFLATYNTTANQADQIVANINLAAATAAGQTDPAKLTVSQKSAIAANIAAAAKAVDLTAIVNTTAGTISIQDKNGKQVAVTTAAASAVKQTGNDYSLALVGLLSILLAGVVAVRSRVRKSLKNI
jgi:hypothetical protein